MRILADATLPKVDDWLKNQFELTLYKKNDDVKHLIQNHDILVCRSTLKVTADLLVNTKIQCVATASSGTCHIDCEYLKQQNIKLLDAKGSNARSVADYVIAIIAHFTKNKQQRIHKICVIGYGAVGEAVTNRLCALNYNVICYDPLLELTNPNFKSCTLADIKTCDLISIHANLHDNQPFPSKNLFNSHLINSLKDATVIVNAARGDIVNEDDLLNNDKNIIYCTDVYSNEPLINKKILNYATICTPHIAGHSIEAKLQSVYDICLLIFKNYGNKNKLLHKETNSASFKMEKTESTWYDNILRIYNPMIETEILKNSDNTKEVFLKQRKLHTIRHDFNTYQFDLHDKYLQFAQGIFSV